MEREVMKKSKQNFILICMYKKIYEPFVKTNKINIYQRPLCQIESSFL
jgi:hypothetical protein